MRRTGSAATSSACSERRRLARPSRTSSATVTALEEEGAGFAVSASFGAAILPEEAQTASAALTVADRRLYAQKHLAQAERGRPHDVLLLRSASASPRWETTARTWRSSPRRSGSGWRSGERARRAAARGRAPRHRQARHARRRAAQAGPADAGRVVADAQPHADRGADPRELPGARACRRRSSGRRTSAGTGPAIPTGWRARQSLVPHGSSRCATPTRRWRPAGRISSHARRGARSTSFAAAAGRSSTPRSSRHCATRCAHGTTGRASRPDPGAAPSGGFGVGRARPASNASRIRSVSDGRLLRRVVAGPLDPDRVVARPPSRSTGGSTPARSTAATAAWAPTVGHGPDGGDRTRLACVSARAKSFDYAVSLDETWDAWSDRGGGVLAGADEAAWTPEHLVLAGLARCTLTSLRYHCVRAGIALTSSAHDPRHRDAARDRTAGSRSSTIAFEADVSFDPKPDEDDRRRAAREGRAGLLRRRVADGDADVHVARRVSATLLDVAAVRARFSALDRRLAFFDGPGGTQCPDEVIDAIAALPARATTRTSARRTRPRERTDALVDDARTSAPRRSSAATPGEVAFGQSMTALNFLLTRAFARELARRRRGARDAARPRRERRAVARAPARPRDRRPLRRRHGRPRARLRRPRATALRAGRASSRSRPPRTPSARRRTSGASSSSPTRRARSRGSTPSTTGRTGRSTSPPGAATSSSARRTSSSGRTWGWRSAARSCCAAGAPYKVRPAADEPVGHRFELGTSPARAARRASSPRSTTSTRSAGRRWSRHERALGAAVPRRPPGRASCSTACRRWRAACRRSASASPGRTRASRSPTHLATRDVAVWWGNYYALETIRRLGLDEVDGAVRAGIVHYNTAEEVDRLLAGLAELV